MNFLVIKKSVLFTVFFLTISLMIKTRFAFDCSLPNGCLIETKKYGPNQYSNERNLCLKNCQVIKCRPQDESFQFQFIENAFMANNSNGCFINDEKNMNEEIILKWPKNTEPNILDQSFNISNLFAYTEYFYVSNDINFINLKGFEIHLNRIIRDWLNIRNIAFSSCTMNFYTNGKLIKSCRDILATSSTVMSIFQLKSRLIKTDFVFVIESGEFKTALCPLVFRNIYISRFMILGMVDSFYKKNVLKFTDDKFHDIHSTIEHLSLQRVENINLNLELLNPYVFSKLVQILILGAVKTVDRHLFRNLASLRSISFHSVHFRKLIHRNGIDWIKEINEEKQYNLTEDKIEEYEDAFAMENTARYIEIHDYIYFTNEPLFQVFPDEDFCVYEDFPFEQLVLIFHQFEIKFIKTEEFTCTYLWLIQYLDFYYGIYKYFPDDFYSRYITMKTIIESKSFIERSKCNFKRRLELCNKTDYDIKDIWSTIDYYLLNKKLQTAFKIMSYLVSIFGIVTNLLTVIIIVIKSNSDLFKEFKHYIYLSINSIFCIIILVINILSWTTECFYPFEVFCPEIRKVVFFQFFKVIFKECLTTTFRFMVNFSYVAFALNRIAVIKKDENKLLKFISEVSIKIYIAICLIISAGLSVIKYFKYEVNYEYPTMNYPISNEWDIFNIDKKQSHSFDDAFFIVNSISDIINYVIFVLICLIIDIFMIRELRKVMNDKLQKIERLYAEHSKTKVENTKKENDKAMNKAIRMVVINTAIGILFKAPISLIPILNVYAAFYFKTLDKRYINPEFRQFYSSLFFNGFYTQISDFSDFLFVLSISIQPLIYKRFDRKIKTGFDRLFQRSKQQQSSPKLNQ